jgi:hypothetical protein
LEPPVENPVDPDRTGNFKDVPVWTPDTRRGSFQVFVESCQQLSEKDFLARFPAPTLLSDVSVERSSWASALLLNVPEGGGKLGRDAACEVAIGHGSVSRQHALFSREGDAWFLTDLGSSNGTKLNDKPLEPNVKAKLPRDMAILDFGGVRLTYNTPASLFHFIAQAMKAEGRSGGPRSLGTGPSWNASPHAKTQLFMPAVIAPAVAPASGPARPTDRLPQQPPKVRPASPKEVQLTFAQRQVQSIAGSPRRILLTLVVIAFIVVSALRYGRPLAFFLFGGSHPEWFR